MSSGGYHSLTCFCPHLYRRIQPPRINLTGVCISRSNRSCAQIQSHCLTGQPRPGACADRESVPIDSARRETNKAKHILAGLTRAARISSSTVTLLRCKRNISLRLRIMTYMRRIHRTCKKPRAMSMTTANTPQVRIQHCRKVSSTPERSSGGVQGAA